VWLWLRPHARLTSAEQEAVLTLCQAHLDLDQAYQLSSAFVTMLHEHQADRLEEWITCARGSHLPELVTFGHGLKRDKAAVQTGLALPYSQGVVEGHVNRLKLIKRTMYGRASFSLLRQRVLACPDAVGEEARAG
jgi:transposase